MKNWLHLVCLFVSVVLPMRAQSTFGAIVGNIKDSSASMIGGASVKVTNTGENATVQVVSAGNGNYEALNLKPGTYTVTISHPGFQVKTFSDVQLLARQTLRVDADLSVGAVEQTVTVEAKAGVIASETATVASSYGSERILSLPTNLRASTSTSPFYTIKTLPGVQADNGGNLTIQGGLPNQTESSIDGISAQNARQQAH